MDAGRRPRVDAGLSRIAASPREARVNAEVILRPGLISLRAWRAIYRGGGVALDPGFRADVEAGAAALSEFLGRKELLPPLESAQAPSVAELVERRAESLPTGILRLFVALKLGSLAQGASGVSWATVEALSALLSADLLPPAPARDMTDRLALSLLSSVLTGTGEALHGGHRRPAADALRRAGLTPLKPMAQERWALLSGTQLTTATALAGLFGAERVFQTALVAAALSALAAGYRHAPLHPHIHKLHRHPGQIEVAAASRALLCESEEDVAGADGKNGAKARESRAAPMRMGACLDLLRQAGRMLERAANAVTEDPVVVWQTQESVAGIEDSSATSLAADLIALALREISTLAEQRIAAIPVRADVPAPAEADEEPGAAATAAAFVQQIRQLACPAGFDAGAVARLLPMASTAAQVIAVEVLCAIAPGTVDGEAPHDLQEGVRRLLAESIPFADQSSAISAVTLATTAELVRSGAIARASGVVLPTVVPRRSERSRSI